MSARGEAGGFGPQEDLGMYGMSRVEMRLINKVLGSGGESVGEGDLLEAGLGMEDMQRVLALASEVRKARTANIDGQYMQEQERVAGRRDQVRRRLVLEACGCLERIISDGGELIVGQAAIEAFSRLMRLPAFYGKGEESLRRQRGEDVADGVESGVSQASTGAMPDEDQGGGADSLGRELLECCSQQHWTCWWRVNDWWWSFMQPFWRP